VGEGGGQRRKGEERKQNKTKEIKVIIESKLLFQQTQKALLQ
jgi:hypothetical protein